MSLSETMRGLALATALLLGGTGAALAQPLSLGEQFALRGSTGAAMGQVLTGVVKAERVGVLTNPPSICASLVGAIGAQVVAASKTPDSFAVAALTMPGEAAAAVEAFKGRDAVALIFGGQVPAEENYALTKAALRAIADANYQGAPFSVSAGVGTQAHREGRCGGSGDRQLSGGQAERPSRTSIR